MEATIIFLIVLGVITFILLMVISVFMFIMYKNNKKPEKSSEIKELEIQNMELLNNQKLDSIQNTLSTSLLNNLNTLKDSLQAQNDILLQKLETKQGEKLENIAKNNKVFFEEFKTQIDKKMQSDSQKIDQLKDQNFKIREEELQKRAETLDQIYKKIDTNFKEELSPKIDGKFKEIKENFSDIQTQVGSLQSLSNEIKDIHKIFFSDFKTRGIAGETSFENLISDILPKDEYETQYKLAENKIVDFAIKIFQNNDSKSLIHLPIDSKFPSDAYLKYSKVKEESKNISDIVRAEEEFSRNIKEKAKSIMEKYIIKNKTTDLALMFIPSEAIFTEVIKLNGGNLIAEIRSKYKVEIISPVIANYVIYLIKSWHNKYQLVQGSKKYIDFITKFKKRYSDFNKHSDLVLKSSETFMNRIKTLINTNKSIFQIIETFENNNKKLIKDLTETTDLDGSSAENNEYLEIQPTSKELIDEAELV